MKALFVVPGRSIVHQRIAADLDVVDLVHLLQQAGHFHQGAHLVGQIGTGATRDDAIFHIVLHHSHTGLPRIGGTGQHRTAVSVAGERRFRDFRGDATLDDSRFQTAFRLLRQMSFQSDGEPEVDVDGTIHDTCDHGGTLTIRYRRPRKNAVKVLLMMDSGGSMEYYAGLCGALFRAATRSNHFKELHVYYFHNCVYDKLYLEPSLQWGGGGSVPLDWVLRNYDSSYKLILVGDAAMHPYELTEPMYDWSTRSYGPSGIRCLERLKNQFSHLIWLNPNPMPQRRDYWSQTHWDLGKVFPMYELTAEGLAAGMRRLMQKR